MLSYNSFNVRKSFNVEITLEDVQSIYVPPGDGKHYELAITVTPCGEFPQASTTKLEMDESQWRVVYELLNEKFGEGEVKIKTTN